MFAVASPRILSVLISDFAASAQLRTAQDTSYVCNQLQLNIMNDYDEQLCELAGSGSCSAGYPYPSYSRPGESLALRHAEDMADLTARRKLIEIEPEAKPVM